MKKTLYSILALLAFSAAAVSCVEDAAYEKGEPDLEGCLGVYFPAQESVGSLVFDPAMAPEISIEVVRNVSNGDCDVPFEVSGDAEVFDFGTIHFEDGQSSTNLEVSFERAKIGESYTVSLQITDPAYASKYLDGRTAVDFTVLRVEWKYLCVPGGTTPAKINWVQNWWGEVHTGYVKYYEVDKGGDLGVVRTCQTVTDPKLYENEDGTTSLGYGFWGTADNLADAVEWTFYWFPTHKRSDGSELIFIPYQKSGWYHSKYQEDVYVFDDYGWKTGERSLEGFLEFAEDNEETVSYYDGNGGIVFFISTLYLFNADGGWQPNSYDTFGIAEGYIRPDYTLKLAPDYCVDGYLPLNAVAGRDIKTLKIAVAPGSLSSSDVKKILNSIDELENVVTFDEPVYDAEEDVNLFAGVLADLGESGLYTIVVAGVDANGEVQASASVEAYYVAETDHQSNAVELTVGTETISSRYEAQGMDSANSFAFYICGKGITDAHVMFVSTEKYLENENLYNAALKADKDEIFALGEAEVAAINRTGGYSDVAADCKALTSYTVVVWATNGKEDVIATAEYTTTGLPNDVVYEEGVYGYTIILQDVYGEDAPMLDPLNLEYNPNSKGYEIPHWGADVTFKFFIDEETGEIDVPLQYTGVSMAGVGDFYVTSPAHFDDSWKEWLESEGEDLDGKSYSDETGYHFYVAYFSSAGYYFGIGYEHYLFETPDVWPGFEEDGEEEGGEEAGTFSHSFDFSSIQKSLHAYPAAGFKGYEREIQTVSVTAVPAQCRPVAREKGCNRPMSSIKYGRKF